MFKYLSLDPVKFLLAPGLAGQVALKSWGKIRIIN